MAEDTVLSNYVPGFRANLNLSPQQQTSRLLMAVESDLNHSEPGQLFNADEVGTSDPEDVSTRVPDTPDKFIDQTRRVGYFREFHDSAWFDKVDDVKQITDPTSTKMRALMAGMGRKRDTTIIANGMFGPAYEMVDDGGVPNPVAFPAGQIVAANYVARMHQDEIIPSGGVDYGMSIGKFIRAQLLLDDSELEGERYVAMGPAQKADLLALTPTTSKWYTSVEALHEGKTDTLMGFKVIPLPRKRIPLKAGTTDVRSIPFWIKPALIYKGRTITNASIRIRNDKADTPQAYYRASHGVCRRYDGGVVRVDCKEVD